MSFGTHSSVNGPSFDAKGGSFAQHEQEVECWNHMPTVDATKRRAALALQMAACPLETCMALGTPKLMSVDGATDRTQDLKAYSAPHALDSVYQDAAKFFCDGKTA